MVVYWDLMGFTLWWTLTCCELERSTMLLMGKYPLFRLGHCPLRTVSPPEGNVVLKKTTLIINNNESIIMIIYAINQSIIRTNNQPIICNHWHSDGLMANLWDSTSPKLTNFSSEISSMDCWWEVSWENFSNMGLQSIQKGQPRRCSTSKFWD